MFFQYNSNNTVTIYTNIACFVVKCISLNGLKIVINIEKTFKLKEKITQNHNNNDKRFVFDDNDDALNVLLLSIMMLYALC